MKKPESFWCCDSRAILEVIFCFIQKKKLIKEEFEALFNCQLLTNCFQCSVGLGVVISGGLHLACAGCFMFFQTLDLLTSWPEM